MRLRPALACAALVVAVAIGCAAAVSAASGSFTLRATADASARSDRPGAADGRGRRLAVSSGRTRRVAYLRFTIPAHPGRLVNSATLRVFTSGRSGRPAVVLRAVRATQWRESTLRWRNRPGLGRIVARDRSLRRGRWASFDATELVRSAGGGRMTMALAVASRSGSATFHSRHARSRRPQLIVQTVTGTGTPGSTPGSTPSPSPGSTPSPSPGSTPGPGDAVVTAAGDIAGGDSGSNDEATAAVVERINPTVALTLGDNAYVSGTLSEYQTEYAPSWGAFKAKTRPSPGNHEYDSTGAQGYYDYFDGVGANTGPAGTRGQGYYSFDVGSWHLIALNPHVSASAGSPQEQWLKADLDAHPSQCTLAYWHEPRFTSGSVHSDDTSVGPFWSDLYAAGADVVLNGHNHQYERFAPQDPTGEADASRGIREFVVGTGGAGLYAFAATPQPNSEVRDDTSHGVLKLTLHAGSYDWQYVPIAGDSFTDSGTANCH